MLVAEMRFLDSTVWLVIRNSRHGSAALSAVIASSYSKMCNGADDIVFDVIEAKDELKTR
jgi:hypothetical protein